MSTAEGDLAVLQTALLFHCYLLIFLIVIITNFCFVLFKASSHSLNNERESVRLSTDSDVGWYHFAKLIFTSKLSTMNHYISSICLSRKDYTKDCFFVLTDVLSPSAGPSNDIYV